MGVGNVSVITNPEGERVEVVRHTADFKPPVSQQKKPTLVRRPCMYLASFVKCLPVVFISGIVGWSYYAYVVALVFNAMSGDAAEQVVCAVIYHIVTVLFVWSYWMTIFTPPGRAPARWHLSPSAVASLSAATSEDEWKSRLASVAGQMGCNVKQRSVQGAVRYCEKCECIKPDRSHHCSVCEVCTLKMDHHCPWVNNCVGFANYKFFMLFLCYALIYCIFIALTSLKYFVRFWEDSANNKTPKYHIMFVFLVSLLFTISLSSLFWYHVYLVLHNRSTLEQFRGPIFDDLVSDKEGWSLGKLNNVREVFGTNPTLWLLPIQTHIGDGLSFPHRRAKNVTNYNSLGNTELARPESPNRTLVNPILTSGGVVSTSQTLHSASTSLQHSGKQSAMSGLVSPLALVSPECDTEVVLQDNGHTTITTVSVQAPPKTGDLTELVVQ